MPSLPHGEGSAEERLRASNALLRAIARAQADFIRGEQPGGLLHRLLAVVLELTGSMSGVMGEVLTRAGGPSLRLLASLPEDEANAVWELPVPGEEPPAGEPGNLRALLGAVFTTGAPVLSGCPDTRPAFLGLPLESGGERVGLVGLAHRPGGYDAGLIGFLQPFLDTCGELLAGARNEQRRRQAEQELRHTQEASAERVRLLAERLRLMLESVQDGLWDLDMTTGRLFANRAWLGMLGYAEGELEYAQSTWAYLCHPDDVAATERLVQEHVKGTLPLIESEQRLRRKDGGWCWVLTRARVVARDEQGRPLRMVGTNVDITSQKHTEERLHQQEEELRRHRDSLEELVRYRSEKLLKATIELEEQQAQLIQSEKMASLGQMAAGVAHEINNPVSYVMSNLGTLDQYVSSLTPLLRLQHEMLAHPDGPHAELLERMGEHWEREEVDYLLGDMPELIEESLAGTRRIKEIAQSLRSFAREDSGEPQLVDVNTELASSLRIVWNELKYKCEVKRDFGPLPPVSCHPTQISQVFTNLLVNAAQAIETRGEIRIRTRQEASEVVVEIADNGQGMTPETVSKLFTPFFTTKPRGQGTGLGLSVSYGIIARHQGRIDVQSQPGQGSTFTIRLPIAPR